MQLLFYIIIYPILWIISILPFPVLYLFSDFVCFIVYNLIGYRKKVVQENLKIALPHLNDLERKSIEKRFYSHMCDMFLEMIKTMSISKKEIQERYKFTNMDLYLDMEKKGKSIALLCAHYASYEWIISMNYYINFTGYGVYKKIANKYFDKLVHKIRSRFKAILITTKETVATVKECARTGKLGVYGFASDQSPKAHKGTHWGKFMGVETPIHVGAELLAKRLDMNVIFLKTKKVKRGYYEATFEHLVDNPIEIPNFEISEMFMKKVEQQILEAPEYYLWTHKRWKHKRQA